MSDRASVKLFLQELKQVIKIWPIFFVNRPQNSVQDLADLNITANSRRDIIAQLDIEDYCLGPEPETQYNGRELWVFGKIIKNQEIYIKLTIIKDTGKAICISFHKAVHPMAFIFKEQND